MLASISCRQVLGKLLSHVDNQRFEGLATSETWLFLHELAFSIHTSFCYEWPYVVYTGVA